MPAHCFFCNHPGLRNLDPETALKVDLKKICEAHLDYQIFYQNKVGQFPIAVTPRMVLNFWMEAQAKGLVAQIIDGVIDHGTARTN